MLWRQASQPAMEIPYKQNIHTDHVFNELFNSHWNGVYELCLRYCTNEFVAKDLTQNIFLSVWERKISFKDKKSAEQYLSKSAKYQVLNYLRDKKDAVELDEFTGNKNTTETYRYNPDSIYTCNELSRKISVQIETLPEPSKTIFKLSRYEALNYLQIAAQMGVSVKTVEKHISKALRSLKSALLQ